MPEIRGSISTASGTVQANVEVTANSATFVLTGTHAGFTGVFEVSMDGVLWMDTVAARRDQIAGPSATWSLGSNENGIWDVPTRAVNFVRLRATSLSSGSVNVILTPTPWNVVFPRTSAPMSASSPGMTEVTNFPATQAVDTELPAAQVMSDAVANPTAPVVGTAALLWNGTAWERAQSNQYIQLDPSQARTTSGTGVALLNRTCRGAIFYANVTAISGVLANVSFRVQESYDGTNYRDVDTSLLQNGLSVLGLVRLEIGPNAGNVSGTSRSGMLPRLTRLAWTITGTTPSATFSTSACLVR